MADHKGRAGAAGMFTWQVLLHAAAPALLYTALSSIAHSLFAASGLIVSKITMQAASVGVCLLFFGWYAARERLEIWSRKKGIYRYPASFCYAIAVVMCGVVNNYLFAIIMSKVQEFPSDYWRVTEIFYNNELAMEIVTLCVIGPLAEELVYRGFVYQRLRSRGDEAVAAVLSALLFGVMHFNLIQGVYAFVLGILLAHIVYKTGSLVTAAAAHMAVNLVSVLWTETDWMGFLDQSGSRQYAAAVFGLVLMAIFLSYGNQLMRHEKK